MHKPSTNDPKFNPTIIARLEQSILIIKSLYGNNLIEIDVFGSYAHGGAGQFSSIDLLIVIEESSQRFIKRIADVQRALNENSSIPQIDPLVYTENELLELMRKKESYVDSALKEAIVVWNGVDDINLKEISLHSEIKSRYCSKTPNLEEIDYSDRF